MNSYFYLVKYFGFKAVMTSIISSVTLLYRYRRRELIK